ncbi:MAG TPA: DUF4383 domain-containing protein [Thermoleophilaceae bacterium]|nr:DUF4383 domain-containing protein [Thermoleophilaceae bacterium]
MSNARTPAQMYALVFGALLLVIGVIGFFVDSAFESGSEISGDELILFEVNGWHNIVHIASGLVGLAMAGSAASARLFALGFGVVYGVVTLWGFIDDPILNLIPVNTADNFLHLAIAGAGIWAGLASSPRGPDAHEPRPSTAA